MGMIIYDAGVRVSFGCPRTFPHICGPLAVRLHRLATEALYTDKSNTRASSQNTDPRADPFLDFLVDR